MLSKLEIWKKSCRAAGFEPNAGGLGSSPGWSDHLQSLKGHNLAALWPTVTHSTAFETGPATCLWIYSCRSAQGWMKCITIITITCTHPCCSWPHDFSLVATNSSYMVIHVWIFEEILHKMLYSKIYSCQANVATALTPKISKERLFRPIFW